MNKKSSFIIHHSSFAQTVRILRIAIPFFLLIAVVLSLMAPLALFADGFPPDPLVPECNKVRVDVKNDAGKVIGKKFQNPCDFPELIHLVKHLMDFAIYLAMPLSAVLFSYAGWLYLASAASPDKKKKAHAIFWAVLVGLLWVLGAWLVIKLISDTLLRPGYSLLG